MTRQIDLDRALTDWMTDGPESVRDAVVYAALDTVRHTRQWGPFSGPWRYLTMAATHTGERRSLTPMVAAAALLFAVAIGSFAILRPEIEIGNPFGARHFTEADVTSVVAAPAASGDYVLADISDEFVGVLPTHLVLGNSPIPFDESTRINGALLTGLESDEIALYDAVGASGVAVPVTEQNGASLTVLSASYEDPAAADVAFDAFVEGYDTWQFAEGRQAWDHGDEGIVYPYSMPADAHGRCFTLNNAMDACPMELRVWREGNLIVTVLQEGDGGLTAEQMVSLIDEATN